MKFKAKYPYDTADKREDFAKFISCLIEGAESPDLPYKPNDYDSYFWTVDLGNNWKIHFDEEDPSLFTIHYRYNKGNDFEETFGAWLEKRIHNLKRVYELINL